MKLKLNILEANSKASNDSCSEQRGKVEKKLRVRQEMEQCLYKIVKEKCSIPDPSKEARALEKLLFQSTDEGLESYAKMDLPSIESKLKDIGTKILLRRLRKRQRRIGGFRNKMILKMPVLANISSSLSESITTTIREGAKSKGQDKAASQSPPKVDN